MPRYPCAMTSNGKSASNSRNSRSFPKLPEAMTSRSRRACTELGGMQPGDALGGEIQQLIEFVPPKGVAFRRAWNRTESAATVHDHFHIVFGIQVTRAVQTNNRR